MRKPIPGQGAIAVIASSLLSFAVGLSMSRLQGVAAASSPAVITTQAIRIVDSHGNLRVAISANERSGAAGLSIFQPNNDKVPRVIVSVRSDGAGAVELRDSSGYKRAQLLSGTGGESSLILSDQDQSGKPTPRLIAGVSPDTGVASVSIFQPNNSAPRLLLGVRSDGTSSLELRDSSGNERGELTTSASGDVRLNLVDKDLKGGVLLGSSSSGSALVFNDAQPKHRAVFHLSTSGEPTAQMYDKDGTVTWQAPPIPPK